MRLSAYTGSKSSELKNLRGNDWGNTRNRAGQPAGAVLSAAGRGAGGEGLERMGEAARPDTR